ncbi:MAG TPA: hypothetical protein VIY47_13150, partial [Ignavibacteriaceae bacterium]
NNPLKQYFRQFKLFLKIPSGTTYYKPADVQFTDGGEIGVMPMTGSDELILKNPDALLNGEAILAVIKSCVPSIKTPKLLLTNDIDAIITAIRYATFNDALESEIDCPKCGHHNTYTLDLQYALDNMTYLEEDYVVNLESGLSVFVKPYSYPEVMKSAHAEFEKNKLLRALQSETLSDDKRAEIFNKAFRDISVTKFDLLGNSIIKIVDESNNIDVQDKIHIKDFLQNIDKKSVDQISDLINEINNIGIKRTFTAVCAECQHNWEDTIDFNPVNFS